MHRSPSFKVYYDAMPIGGVDGTIRNRMKGTPAEGNVHAKTGSVALARSLSGYVTTANGRMLIFSFLANNWTVPVRSVERVQDAIAARLASHATPLDGSHASTKQASGFSPARDRSASRTSRSSTRSVACSPTTYGRRSSIRPGTTRRWTATPCARADVRAATAARPVVLPVLETVRAGQRPTNVLAPNAAIRIMTGAPIPDGADSVIRVEDTDGGEERVAIRDARDAGRNVRPRGEDLQTGRPRRGARHGARPGADRRARLGRRRNRRGSPQTARRDSRIG